MEKKYRVVFVSLRVSEGLFKANLSRLGVEAEAVETMIQRAPITLKKNMPLALARNYAEAVQAAGGKVRIQDDGVTEEDHRYLKPVEIKPMDCFTRCPECGYMQLKERSCRRCGHHLD
ncbi:MAG: hypothetical protein JRJ03_01530 [Deltaproteobacteria bacterium]|nr:hypothetical protein [Deltaproteobacteria bacterium]